MVLHDSNPGAEEAEAGGSLGLTAASHAVSVSSDFSEKHCLKKQRIDSVIQSPSCSSRRPGFNFLKSYAFVEM